MAAHKLYRGRQIEGATPLGLILLVYEALVQSLIDARSAAEDGDVERQVDQTSRAMQALMELMVSLDHEKGGEIAGNLASLYTYMHRRLLEGQGGDVVAALNEVLKLAQTLRESWMELAQSQNQTTQQQAEDDVARPRLAVAA